MLYTHLGVRDEWTQDVGHRVPDRVGARACDYRGGSLLVRCVPADARVDVYLWIRTATIAASMTA